MTNLATNQLREAGPAEPAGEPVSTLSTEEIEKLVTDNMGLAHWFAKQWRTIPGADESDILSQATHGLVKAANTYRPEKGPFAGYASQIIRNYLGHMNHKNKTKTHAEVTSMDAPIGDDGDDDSSLHDKTADSTVDLDLDADQSDAAATVRAEVEKLPEPDRSMVRRWMAGESYRDMQSDFRVSFVTVRNKVQAALEKIRSSLEQQGVTSLGDIWGEGLAEDPDADGKAVFECLVAAVTVSKTLAEVRGTEPIRRALQS